MIQGSRTLRDGKDGVGQAIGEEGGQRLLEEVYWDGNTSDASVLRARSQIIMLKEASNVDLTDSQKNPGYYTCLHTMVVVVVLTQ